MTSLKGRFHLQAACALAETITTWKERLSHVVAFPKMASLACNVWRIRQQQLSDSKMAAAVREWVQSHPEWRNEVAGAMQQHREPCTPFMPVAGCQLLPRKAPDDSMR